jgi:hypothetical protein
MNFLATLTDSGTQVNKVINANSWSSCLAYCEGTGFDITFISQISSNTTVVLNNPTSQNCYNVTLKSNSSSTGFNYFVFDTDFNSLETWLAEQTDTTVVGIQLSQKSYVTV